jgi:two-component system, NtrC family, response regulator HydG
LIKKPSILIVDDEESIRVSLEGILKRKYCAKTAENGSMALEMLKNDYYDLILTDIMMDDMTGIELLKITKERFPEIPVILMTGYSSLSTAIEAMRLGASDYLIKPYSKKAVFLSIARCIENNLTGKNEKLTQYFQTGINTLSGQKALTKRELEVFSHLISGMSDKCMSEELAVTLPTIKFHLQNIYKKLGINGRKGVLKIISSYKGYQHFPKTK